MSQKNLSRPRRRGGFFSLILSMTAGLWLFGLSACSEPESIGLDLIDGRASFARTDTITVMALTIRDDSIPSSWTGQNMLGLLNDPVFGKARASIYTNTRLSENNLNLGENLVLDSVSLTLAYTGRFYGKIEGFQTLRVYELSEQIPDSDTIYSNRQLSYYPEALAEMLLRPAPRDSVLVDSTVVAPHITIPLSAEFGQRLLDASGTEFYQDVTTFLDFFKGFFITVNDQVEGEGSVFNINMTSPFTTLNLYYHEEGDTIFKRHQFHINEFSRHFNLFEHFGHEQADLLLQAQINDESSTLGDSLVFVQAMGGLRIDISLPYVQALNELSNVAINQARLVIPIVPESTGDYFSAPVRLILLRYDEDGEIVPLRDMSVGDEYFGGLYDQTNGHYRFNITQHLQQILDGALPDNGLTLVVGGAAEYASRAILNGPGQAENPMRLEIIYTVFD